MLEVYREPIVEAAAPFGWRYAGVEVFDAASRVTPLALPGASITVASLLP